MRLFKKKYLSIITFKPMIPQKYSKLPKSNLEKIENFELLRAIENEMNVGIVFTDSKSISVDIKDDYFTATELMKKDKIRKKD